MILVTGATGTTGRYVVQELLAAGAHSGLGASPDAPFVIGRWHGEAQRHLERSGLPFTHLQPHSFMQNLLGSAKTIAAEGTLYAPMGDARVSLVDVRDIAAVAARVLLEPGHTGRTYVITGPEALTYRELAAKLSAATGRPVRYVDVTPAQAKQSMMAAGMPEWAADAVNELSAWYRAGHGALVTQVVAEIGGRTPHTFDTFARDHAAAFRGG